MAIFEGIIPALVTPFDARGQLDENMLRRLAEQFVGLGVQGLYLCGGTGEGVVLEAEERKRIATAVIDQVKGRVPVIVHVGSVSTPQSVDLAAHAASVKADAIASVPPFYYGVSRDGIGRHYAAIAATSRLPLIIYNIPGAVNVTVTPAMAADYVQAIPTLAGIKFSSYNLFEMWGMLQLQEGRFTVLSGNDEILISSLAMGAHGGVGLTYNLMPGLYLELYRRFGAGDLGRAREMQGYANQVISILLRHPVLGSAKLMLKWKGYDCGLARGPIDNPTEAQQQSLRTELEKIGFFQKDFGL
ncbi:MAG: dihydrodipicolinate synthase family protein [Bryobacteraceae bacterium]